MEDDADLRLIIILVNKQAGLLGLLGLIVLIKPNELSAQ
jgi:hypothetical protein